LEAANEFLGHDQEFGAELEVEQVDEVEKGVSPDLTPL
jgi:hypothetical protein